MVARDNLTLMCHRQLSGIDPMLVFGDVILGKTRAGMGQLHFLRGIGGPAAGTSEAM
jgi:hypothetical protein